MAGGLGLLIATAAAFVGSHLLLSGPLRQPLVARAGEGGFLGLYSLVGLATFGALVLAFTRTVPSAPLWDGMAAAQWLAASLLTLVALALFVGSFQRNPALPQAPVAGLAERAPAGAFRVTRHPMMIAFALWSLAHMLVAPTGRTIVLCLAVFVLALAGSHHQDRRKRALLGAAWEHWMAVTSFWPRWQALPALGLIWPVALLLWLGVTWAHLPLAGMPAGPWRWLW